MLTKKSTKRRHNNGINLFFIAVNKHIDQTARENYVSKTKN